MSGMIAWFARNEVAANLLMVLIIFMGLWALAEKIPLEVFPSFERDAVNISMAYRGATPAEVEESVVIRIEEAIEGLQGIEEITSNASEGSARIRVEVTKGYDPRALLDDIKNRVDAINTFPQDTERPVYSVVEITREVISVVISGELPENELRRFAEQVRDELSALPEISLVELGAVRPFEISIEISESTLDRYGLTFDAVVEAIQRSSVDLPAGAIKTRGGEILLRTKGQAYTGEDYAKVVLVTRADGTRLALGDIAEIKDGFEEEPLYSEFNGAPAALIDVFRTGEQNALEIGAAVRRYVAAKQASLPQGLAINYWRDRSRIVKLRLNTLLESALQGGILIFLILALFLRLSVAVWVCVGIPISFLGALALMPYLGLTINLISLFAFILVLGIVVDDAIVTGENIYSHLKRADSATAAAILGTQQVAVPVTFGILTSVAAFVPLLMIEGVRGALFATIPAIVIPVLLFSWLESKLILPAHMKHVHPERNYRRQLNALQRAQRRVADGLEHFVTTVYGPLLDWALRQRYLTLSLFVGFSLIMLALVVSGRYSFTFFPRVQSEVARASLTMPAGTPVEITRSHLDHMASVAHELQQKYYDPTINGSVIDNILVSVGWLSLGSGPSEGSGKPEEGQVSLELVPPEDRSLRVTSSEIVNEWRKGIGAIPGAEELTFRAEIGRGGDPIDIQLSGQHFEQLEAIADVVKQRLEEYPGVFDIEDSFEDGQSEIKLRIKPEAELLGLNAQDLGRQVRQAFFGAEAQRVQRNRDDVRVMVRYPEAERRTLQSLDTMRIRTREGVEVPLGNVAEISMGQGFATIRRIDRQRVIDVTADVNKEEVDVNRIITDLDPLLKKLTARYPGVRYQYEGELREQRESFTSLKYGVGFVLFSIYALLAIPFRSYSQPLMVMLVIPFSVIGAFLGHMLMGMSLSIMSIMGMLALAGVAVNDSLVLVDWINQRRTEGVPLIEAVCTSGVARFRPILLTSLTTFAGLLPLIFERSTQAQFLIPMAVSLGFGVLYATFLSLLLVPVAYLILEDMKRPFVRSGILAAHDTQEINAYDRALDHRKAEEI
jgi:multidrug efflux pump subunit AcrB